LALVVCGAASFRPLPEGSAPGKALRVYAAVSGADNSYGFFAPEVGEQTRVVLTITDGAGRSWDEPLTEVENQEVRLRVGSLYGAASEDGQLRRELAASWAARAFRRHPGARAVAVRIDSYDVPTMDEVRAGEAPEWQTTFRRSFRRGRDHISGKGGER
jgi:hypothetical protein